MSYKAHTYGGGESYSGIVRLCLRGRKMKPGINA
jgi:hypothetical protein